MLHIATIIEDFIPEELRQEVLSVWPSPDWIGWHKYANGKLGSRTNALPTPCLEVIDLIQKYLSGTFPKSIPDKTLWGSGLHDMRDNASLGFHRDAERHQLNPNWTREATAIVYLDTLDRGGELVFGEVVRNVVTPIQTIQSIARRLVFFSNDNHQLVHGVRPVGNSVRRTITLFFWRQNPQPQFQRPSRSIFLSSEAWEG